MSPGSAPGDGLGLAVVSTVRSGAPGYQWAAAVVGWHAADLQLASNAPVWALGGYSGHDPHPGLGDFLTAAAHHRVHFLLFTAHDLRAPGDAGRIVRWAVNCLPLQQVRSVLTVDLTDVGTPAQRCALPRSSARRRG